MKPTIEIKFQVVDIFGAWEEKSLIVPKYYNADHVYELVKSYIEDNNYIAVHVPIETIEILTENHLTLIN